jgi:hypothetical protein
VAALVKRMLEGRRPAPGARPAAEDVELTDYEEIFAGLDIRTGVRDEPQPGASLYRRLMGEAFDRLPAPLQALHEPGEGVAFEGRADVARSANPLANLAANLIGFPKAGSDVAVRVDFTVRDGRETWTRTFAGRRFSSVQEAGPAALLTEWFGPQAFDLAILEKDGVLSLVMRGWRFLSLPMPRALGPRITSYESAEGGRFNFHVEIGLPVIGRLVRYDGWLERAS